MLRLQQVNQTKFHSFSIKSSLFAMMLIFISAFSLNAQDCSSVPTTIGDLIYLGEYNNSKYYCSSHNNFTWHQAKAEAEAYGGQLLVIDDAAENEFVRSSIMADYVWHSLSDANNEGDFRTTTGEAASYLNWNPGEPNNSNGTEHYARILKSSGKWTDRDEFFTAEYVMEIACGGNQVCKNRTAENVVNCNNGNIYGGWMKFNEVSTNDYTLTNGVLTEYTDGTGTYTGTWTHNTDPTLVFDYELSMTGRTTKAPNTPKPHHCLTPEENNYYYYEDFTGTVYGRNNAEGAVIAIQSFGAAFQLGIGANATGTDSLFGGSAWFSGELISGPTTGLTLTLQGTPNEHFGDINIKLSEKVNGDQDNDGVCDIEDCNSSDPNLPATPGSSCDDGNANTINDLVQADGCTCAGTAITNDCTKYKISDAIPECGPFNSEPGVFYRRDCSDSTFEVWRAGSDLTLEERGDGTASITGTIFHGNTEATVSLELEGYSTNGNNWTNECYNNNMTEEYFYTGFSGTVTVGTDVFTLTQKYADFVFGQGAQNQSTGDFGFGGWIDGTWGNCVESFGTLTPILPGDTCDDGDSNTSNDVILADGCTCEGTDLPNIGNKVFFDTNNDGKKNGGEAGVAGVDVILFAPGPDGIFHTGDDVAVDTKTTNANGTYSFNNVVPGTYCIEFDITTIPANYLFTTQDVGTNDNIDSDANAAGKTDAFTVTAGQDNDYSWDAGLKLDPADVGDKVFLDANGNGIQDNGEAGVENVDVKLFSAGPDGVFHTGDDVLVDSKTTDVNGNYLFEDVPSGSTYCIEFDITTIPATYVFTGKDLGGDDTKDSDVDAAGKTAPFTVTDGTNDPDYDAGIKLDPADVGDKVFLDDNRNGIQDNGEVGVENVEVKLFAAGPDGVFHTGDDILVTSDTTDANGNYLFEDLSSGTPYCIEFNINTIPANYEFTEKDQGGDDTKDSDADADGKTDPFTVTDGTNDPDYDAGIKAVNPDIKNRVFFDDNKNGIQDPSEAGVENVAVSLYSAGPDGIFYTADDVIIDTDQTDVNGDYNFDNVAPGTYYIGFDETTLPVGFGFTFRDLGNDDDLDSDANLDGLTEPFTVILGQTNDPQYDAGIFESGSIGNKVWDDQNGNGIQDNDEPGIQGVFVFLEDEFGNPVPNVMYQVTDVNGAYLFAGLPLGNYIVRFATPGGLYPTLVEIGGDDTADSNADILEGKSGVITIDSANPNDLTVDAGYVTPVKITGIVWYDDDEDGTQGTTEAGVANVKVTLYEAGPDMLEGTADDVRVTDNITGNDGMYLFFNVLPGKYFVNFDPNTLPTDYEFTMNDLGGDDNLDSDADANTGNSPVFMINSAIPFSGVDAGLIFSTNLPVDLISFTAELINSDKVLLKWATAWEQNNNFFEVQRSTDGDRFVTIGTVQGQGTTNSINNYNFVDESPFYGRNYYRLKQVDYDGTTDLSEVQSILIDNEALPDVIAYPNPTKDVTTLRVVTPFEEDATVEVVNSAGQILEVIIIEEGSNSQQIDLSKYQPGFYFLNINYNGFRKLVHRVLKVRD